MKRLSVLIIEDSVYDADLSVREIRKLGFEVKYKRIENQKSMLKALQEEKWDVILCDYSMPNFDAINALETRNSVAGAIPFFVVSEYMSDETMVKVMSAGCNGYVAKENLSKLREIMSIYL